jgi:hypothetical protein
MSKEGHEQTLFYFTTAFIFNVRKKGKLFRIQFLSIIGTYNLQCFRRNKFVIRIILRNSQYFCAVDSDMYFNDDDDKNNKTKTTKITKTKRQK